MKPTDTITNACTRFIRELIAAKGRWTTEDQYWKDRKSSKAYGRLCDTIGASVSKELGWWHSVWSLAGSAADRIWAGEYNEAAETEAFAEHVLAYLDALAGHDWIAALPLEVSFNKFPEYTDFGRFQIVNATTDKEDDTLDDLLKRFRDVLVNKVGINFIHPDNPNISTYINLGDHFYKNKTGGYIPGRPQLIMSVGQGDEFINKHVFPTLVSYPLALLSLCQIVYELEMGILATITSGWGRTLPTGETMQDGLIEVPSTAVAFIAKEGIVELWNHQCQLYETRFGVCYEPTRFMQIWNEIGRPLLEIPDGLAGQVGVAIRNGVQFVAECRHSIKGDLSLHSVIATETILNPFNVKGTTSEGLSLFAATLTGSTVQERKEIYELAKELYKSRNDAVHQSTMPRYTSTKSIPKGKAFDLFRACLKSVAHWAKETTLQVKKCDRDAFHDFYLKTVLAIHES